MKKIATVEPYLFENFLVLALDRGWIHVLDAKIPIFKVIIDEQSRLVLVGPTIKKKMAGDNS